MVEMGQWGSEAVGSIRDQGLGLGKDCDFQLYVTDTTRV